MTNLKIAAQIDNALQALSVLLQIFIISSRQFAKRRAAKKDAICRFPLRTVLRPIRIPAQIAHVPHADKRKLLGAGGMNCGIAPLSCNYHMRQSTLRIDALILWILPYSLYTTSYRSVFVTCLRNAYGIPLCLEMPESQNKGANAFAPAPLSQVEDGPWMKMVPRLALGIVPELRLFGICAPLQVARLIHPQRDQRTHDVARHAKDQSARGKRRQALRRFRE